MCLALRYPHVENVVEIKYYSGPLPRTATGKHEAMAGGVEILTLTSRV